MRNKPIQADQLIPTSSTPPPEAGFYRIDRHTIGVVGDMSFRDPDTQVVMPVGKGAIPFTNFAPRLLASLVASSTAACTSGVVTVTATSHGLPATSFDGFGFYYPGSPSLAAGFYESFSRTGANTITFAAPLSPGFGSESVNAGAAFTAEVTLASVDIGANAIVPPSMVSVRAMRIGDGGASTKTLRLKIGGTAMATNALTATSNGAVEMAFSALSSNKQIAHGGSGLVGSTSSSQVFGAVDLTAATTISLTGQISAAGGYMMISSPLMMVE